jgi:hypothetical protein
MFLDRSLAGMYAELHNSDRRSRRIDAIQREASVIEWRIEGRELVSCNCIVGCPCQFNAPPTHGFCDAVVAIQIDQGRFRETPLDGLRAVAVMTWPGAIHEGHGKCQVIIDERASEAQREALLKILSGQETEPGATIFNVFAATFEQVFEPLFKPIEIDIDVDARRGSVRVDGMVQVTGSPILNLVTGSEHRARIDMPDGFEFRIAEVGRASTQASGNLAFGFDDTHAHFARLNMSQNGVAA